MVKLFPGDKAKTIESLAKLWVTRVNEAKHREPVKTLYQGRAFSEAKRTARAVNAPLFVVSAGHGIVSCDELLPAYDLTATPSTDNPLHSMLGQMNKNAIDWWEALTQSFALPRSLLELFNKHATNNCIVVLAVPSTYLSMLHGDLLSLSDEQICRIRIITSEFGAEKLTGKLREMVLPYDERLEGNAAYAGTRNDFPQRALRHFVQELSGHELPIDRARERVISAMQSLTRRNLPTRGRKSDAEIEDLVLQVWHRHRGSQSVLLRWLRDEQLVSCEQSRFRKLWHRVKLKIEDSDR
ncbi:DUF6884 domain-containing protein [Duganella fentianensis]|uniref:DUF6884 domain-containing protein n=1 Tax=Duganella fentianensis TaxID=2692177 RepID=UPI0032B2D19C